MNKQLKKTIMQYKYPICGRNFEGGLEREFVIKLFAETIPLYGFYIRLEAFATIAYGFEFTWGNSESGIGCALTFTPYVKPYLSAYGG